MGLWKLAVGVPVSTRVVPLLDAGAGALLLIALLLMALARLAKFAAKFVAVVPVVVSGKLGAGPNV